MLEFITEKKDCWDLIAEAGLPVFIYGMGDGALKIMKVFERCGIAVSGFFASDEFVRGHIFEGHFVHTLSQVEEYVDDFVIVLAFAAGYESLYSKIFDIAKRHPLFAPDVPVAGEELFTYSYCLENAEKIQAVYDMLADERSKRTFADIINFKISGKIDYLEDCTFRDEKILGGLVPAGDDEVYVDLGAYNGDTAREFIEKCGGKYKHIYAFEPNPKNFRKLTKNLPDDERITLINAAAHSREGMTEVSANEGRMSRIGESGKTARVRMCAVDDAVKEQATLIKLDVEGAEREALLGAERHIKGGAKIMCSLYHRSGDMFGLPLLIKDMAPERKFYIRHSLYIPAWETNLYCV